MKVSLSILDQQVQRLLAKISREVSQAGISAYLVGGIVRDLLLKKKHILDLDIVLEYDAVKFARHLANKNNAALTVFPAFRTATLVFKDGISVDLTTARQESYPRPGSLPKVKPGSLADDLSRRDVTINAMAVSLNKENYGELVDLFDGIGDLKAGKVRILHDKSFIDDPTRILRAVRYEQRLAFQIDRHTLKLLKQSIRGGGLSRISDDRYFNDLRKILEESNVKQTIKRLHDLGGIARVDPELHINFRALAQVQENMRVGCRMLLDEQIDRWFIYFLVLIEEVSVKKLHKIIAKYDFTKQQKKAMVQVFQVRLIMRRLSNKGLAHSTTYACLSNLVEELVWYIWFRSANKCVRRYIQTYLADKNVKLRIDGHDLQKLGLKSGKRMGEILQTIFNQKLDGKVMTRSDELRLARSLVYK